MGVTISGSGTISSSTGSISFDDDNITTTGTIPAAQLTGQVPTANLNNAPDLSSDIRALALQSASDRIGLENGIADPFSDQTDIDTGVSTNEAHDSSGTFYAPTTVSAGSAQDLSSKTYFGNATSNGGLAAAFNGTTSQNYQSSSATTSKPMTVGVALGSGNGFSLGQVKVYAPNNTGYNAPNGIKIYGASSASASGGTLLFSATAGTHYNNSTGDVSTFAINSSTSYENYYAELLFSSGNAYLAELELFSGTLQNMTLVSNSFTADSAPSNTVIGVQVVENESITINTDLTAEVSRDGGTTFTACTLALKTTLAASGTKYYESASTDISSQPSGTSMKYRIKTLNNKNVQVHGVALSWS